MEIYLALEITPDLEAVITHLEGARASKHGLALPFESREDAEQYRRKFYICKKKILDSGAADFSDIHARFSPDSDSTLFLVKESSKHGT